MSSPINADVWDAYASCPAGGLPWSSAWCWFPSPADPGTGSGSGTIPSPPVAPPTDTSTITSRGRDADGIKAIAALLEATGQFSQVTQGRNLNLLSRGGDVPRAWVRVLRWSEKSQGDPEWKLRTVVFAINLTVSGINFDEDDPLDQLASTVQDAVEGRDLGFCLPALTTISEGRYPDTLPNAVNVANGPEASITLSGQFCYFVEGYGSHDEA